MRYNLLTAAAAATVSATLYDISTDNHTCVLQPAYFSCSAQATPSNVDTYGPQYQQHEDVVDFFETTIGYYKQLPTWAWLAKHDILPSNSTGYSRTELEEALAAEHGGVPYVGCSGPRYNETTAGRAANSTDTGRTVLSEVCYYMHVYGRPQDHRFVPVDQTSRSGCTNATGGVSYYHPTAANKTSD